jgi:ribosome biogenesis protein Tsr3
MLYEVIIDHSESANKCSVAPLTFRTDFRFTRVRSTNQLGPLNCELLLHHAGANILEWRGKNVNGIGVIDCNWKRLPTIQRRVIAPASALVSIPEGFVTAYPRSSKRGTDPDTGLATIEAIFTAAALVGHIDPTLFERYQWGKKYLELNADVFRSFDVDALAIIPNLPEVAVLRTADRRKLSRQNLVISDRQPLQLDLPKA